MGEPLRLALQITLIGLGLVFGAIVLLGLVMSLLVRFTSDQASTKMMAGNDDRASEHELKRRAAVAAVAVALAPPAEPVPLAFTPPPTSSVSAWQAVMRGRQLKQRGPTR